ncbi:MAG: aminoacyl-tRNA hydrolase [Lachnospiraceae bacterium]|nr:aminoacyl-tRNA hydrolase [Lachnospiraceae bacterium]
MKLIVGLGNPSDRYAHTRHNLGFDAVDKLAELLGCRVNKREKKALTGSVLYRGEKVLLAKPQTYMNLSGESVRPLMDYYHVAPEDLFVLVDDVNLDIGMLRIRRGGSDGGHNGLKSITEHLGTKDYARLRIGAGAPPAGGLVDFVLSGFSKEDRAVIDETIEDAAEACLVFISQGVDVAMNRFNRKKESAPQGGQSESAGESGPMKENRGASGGEEV